MSLSRRSVWVNCSDHRYCIIARMRVHIRHAILSPPRRTSHQISPFVKRIPSIHSTISASWAPQDLLLSMTPTLSCQGTIGSISPSTRPTIVPRPPEACIRHDGSPWRLMCPLHGRCYGQRRVSWIGRGRLTSEKRRRVRSSACRTRCASL